MRIKTRQPGRSKTRGYSNEKRPPKHINCRGGLMKRKEKTSTAHQLQRQSYQKNQENAAKAHQLQRQHYKQTRHTGKLKHINCRDTLTCHTKEVSSKLCNNQEVNTEHSRSIKWRGYKCRRHRHSTHQDHGNIFTRKIQMLIKSMRIPTFHHKSPTKHRHHTNGEEWTATKQETLQP